MMPPGAVLTRRTSRTASKRAGGDEIGVGGPFAAAIAREALAAAGAGLWSWSVADGVLDLDPVARRHWTRLTLVAQEAPLRPLDDLDPADAEVLRGALGACARGAGGVDVVVRLAAAPRRLHLRGGVVAPGPGGARLAGTVTLAAAPAASPVESPAEPSLRRAEMLGGAVPFAWEPDRADLVAPARLRQLCGLAADGPVEAARLVALIHPDDRARLLEAHREVCRTPGPFEAEFRIVDAGERVRWVLVRGEAEATGTATGIGTGVRLSGIGLDITARRLAESALRRARREARARFREIRALYFNAPTGLALLDRDLRVLRSNRRLGQLVGLAGDASGAGLFEAAPALRAALEPALRRALATGEAVAGVEVEVEAGGATRALVVHAYGFEGEAGVIAGVGLVAEDVTAHRRGLAAQDLLGRELSHRIKNLFAVVSSLITLSARGDPALERFAGVMRERVEALGRAHDHVRPSEWAAGAGEAPTVAGLLDHLLDAYRTGRDGERGARIAVEVDVGIEAVLGPEGALGAGAATALALAVHEFATNAAKYGALSTAAGTVRVRCGLEDGRFAMTWTERGGPVVAGPPIREGFGTTLARRTVAHELGGEVAAEWRREGVVLRLTANPERLRG